MLSRFLIASTVFISLAIPSIAHAFTLEEVYGGKSYAYGKFSAINGVSRSFKVILDGKWDGRVLRLREDFIYDDGVKERKTWVFTKIGEGKYTGTREDVQGTTTVTIRGNCATFNYLVDIDSGPGKNMVRFYDTLIKKPDGTLANTAFVTKVGFPVARTVVNFARTDRQARALKP